MSLCLAKHNVTLPSGGKLVRCVPAATDRNALSACPKQGALQ